MILLDVRLLSFRAHAVSEFAFGPKVNLLVGPNGSGKTNVLEAIHYLCLSKSFLSNLDSYVLRKGAPFFEIEGQFEGERRSSVRVRLAYLPEAGKRIFVNGAPLERLTQIVGQLPIVVFSPADQAITAGGPEERRRFLDNILCQARPVYLDYLLKYRRTLKQRNVLLMQYKGRGGVPAGVLASWDAELIALGSRVISGRVRFLHDFNTFLETAFEQIENVAERPSIEYVSLSGITPEVGTDDVRDIFERELERVSRRECERGRTLVGPHRDELIFRLNELEVRRYASQGQHRTFGLALKLAQYFYLQEQCGESPILLLDDIFDNLDPKRAGAFLALLQSEAIGQSIISAARYDSFEAVVPFDQPENSVTRIVAGPVKNDVNVTS